MRLFQNIPLKRTRRNPVAVRNVRSLSDAIEMYHRTGVFDMRTSDVESYDLINDGSADFVRNVETELMNCEGRCEDLLVAASTQMHSKSRKERQVTNITPPPGGGIAGETPGQE